MTSHWPTYADGMFWCACDNRTYTSEELWLAHAALAWLEEQLNPPVESSARHGAPSR